MLDIEVLAHTEVEKAKNIFQRDGFVCIKDPLTPEQFEFARAGALRVVAEQTAEFGQEKMNRGFARHSFGDQIMHPEWRQLIDLPTTLPILEAIFGSEEFHCGGAGGDWSLPGAEIQHLHCDQSEFFNDPTGRTTLMDPPTPFLAVNFTMTEFNEATGATRFIPGTHRSRHPIPSLDEEPESWKTGNFIEAPPNTALIRDVRCWHGGTANTSDGPRIMTSVGYFAPWFFRPGTEPHLSMADYATLSPRAKKLCRLIVDFDSD